MGGRESGREGEWEGGRESGREGRRVEGMGEWVGGRESGRDGRIGKEGEWKKSRGWREKDFGRDVKCSKRVPVFLSPSLSLCLHHTHVVCSCRPCQRCESMDAAHADCHVIAAQSSQHARPTVHCPLPPPDLRSTLTQRGSTSRAMSS